MFCKLDVQAGLFGKECQAYMQLSGDESSNGDVEEGGSIS